MERMGDALAMDSETAAQLASAMAAAEAAPAPEAAAVAVTPAPAATVVGEPAPRLEVAPQATATTQTLAPTPTAGPVTPASLMALVDFLRANTADAVPALITGETVEAVLASVGQAREAYTAVLERAAAQATVTAPLPRVPAAAPKQVIDLEGMRPVDLIKAGLRTGA